MLVLIRPMGQRSNQFIQHSNLDAFCKENSINFYNPAFQQYKKDYPALKLLILNIIFSKLIWLVLKIKNKINKGHIIDFDLPENIEYYSANPKLLKWNIKFCIGWRFRTPLTEKYRDEYKQQFNPSIDKQGLTDTYLKRISPTQNILGVHIRRGDYKQHQGGIFYFEDDVYLKYIADAVELLGNETKIILFTNDDNFHFEEYTKHFENILLSNCSAVEDQYIMSQCDYIIGPPSTFPLWASYVGKSKLYNFRTKAEVLNINMFKEIIRS